MHSVQKPVGRLLLFVSGIGAAFRILGGGLDILEVLDRFPAYAPIFVLVTLVAGVCLVFWSEKVDGPMLLDANERPLGRQIRRLSPTILQSLVLGLVIGSALAVVIWWRLGTQGATSTGLRQTRTLINAGYAVVKSWGTDLPNDAWVEIDTTELHRYQGEYKLLLICRVKDPRIDKLNDTRLDRSTFFPIQPNRTRLQGTLSNDTLSRMSPSGWLDLLVLLVPNTLQAEQFSTLQDGITKGCQLVAAPSVLVHASPKKP
jgi:hypothetical protein